MNKKELRDNVRPEFLDLYRRHHNAVFEDRASELSQNNRLKLESINGSSFFGTLKHYTLLPITEGDGSGGGGEETIKKTRGILRIAREKMKPTHFMIPAAAAAAAAAVAGGVVEGEEEEEEEEEEAGRRRREKVLTSAWVLKSTRGLQMTMSIRTCALPTTVNYKRYSLVISSSVRLKDREGKSEILHFRHLTRHIP